VTYPKGYGFLDFNLLARTVADARAGVKRKDPIITIPIQRGDVAVLERGGEIYHRGRNASEDDYRLTSVLH
jgi:hypothetical protein